MKKYFLAILVSIAILGLFLRLNSYSSVPPFGETRDEFMYPWQGMSILQTGTPTSWADFGSYAKHTPVTYWGLNFNLVTPWNEKPPLYGLLVGGFSILNGQTTFASVRLATIRLVPIALSFISIIFLGLLAQILFERKTAVLASLLYATVPTIVMANRLSLTENLLIPVTLITLWYFFKREKVAEFKGFAPYFVGIGSGLVLLIKNTGLALPLTILFILILKKQWKNTLIITTITAFFAILHPLMGLYYNWDLYLNVLKEYRNAMMIGLPETMASLFMYPVIGHKEKIFLDGGMLLGYIFFLSAPWWLKQERFVERAQILAYPFSYLAMFALLVGGRTWFGWHLFPLYPFLMLFLAKGLTDLFVRPDIFKYVLSFLVLGQSSLRFVMQTMPELALDWPRTLGGLLAITLPPWIVIRHRKEVVEIMLMIVFAIYIGANVYAVLNLPQLYSAKLQPLTPQ